MTLPALTYRDHLLPSPAGDTEKTFAGLTRRVSAIPAPLDLIYRPYEVPASFLPFLAWQFSVDLWDEEWPEAKKRYVIAESIRLHRMKGTLPGIDAYLRLVNSKVVRSYTPPSKIFLGVSTTDAERRAYLQRFAQLIVRPFVARRPLTYAAYTDYAMKKRAFMGHIFPMNVGDHALFTRTAFIVDNGVEEQITLKQTIREDSNEVAVGCDEVVRAVTGGGKIFLDQTPKNKLYFGTDADPEMVLYRIPRTGFRKQWRDIRATISKTKQPFEFIDIKPEYVKEQHQGAVGAVYAGQFLHGFMPPTISWRYIYERWYLFDRDRAAGARRQGSTFLNGCRFGIEPFTAILRTQVRGKARPLEVWKFLAGHLREHDPRPVDNVLKAIRRSKSLRDTILVSTKTKRAIRPADRVKVGDALRISEVIDII